MDDRELIALLPRRAGVSEAPGPGCPDEERLARFVTGLLPPGERSALDAHVADCAFCLDQVGFLVRAAEMAPAPAVPARLLSAASSRRPRWLAPWRLAAAAALGLAAVTLVLLAPRAGERDLAPAPGGRPVESFRSSPPPASFDAIRLVRPADGERVRRAALGFAWAPSAGALSYTVQIVDSAGDLRWEGSSEDSSVAPPAGVALAPGETYYVWVLAHQPSGASVRSPAVGFEVAPD